MESLFDIFLRPKDGTKKTSQGGSAVEELMKILYSGENTTNSQNDQGYDLQQGQEDRNNSAFTPVKGIAGKIPVPEQVEEKDIRVEVFNKDFSLSVFVDFYDEDTHTVQEVQHTYHASAAIDFAKFSISLKDGVICFDAPYAEEEDAKNMNNRIDIRRI